MDEDCFESDWCDFYNGHNQSEDEVNYDQMMHFMHEIETQQDNESMEIAEHPNETTETNRFKGNQEFLTLNLNPRIAFLCSYSRI